MREKESESKKETDVVASTKSLKPLYATLWGCLLQPVNISGLSRKYSPLKAERGRRNNGVTHF